MAGSISPELRLRALSGVAMILAAVATLAIGGFVFNLVWLCVSVGILSEWLRLTGADLHGARLAIGGLCLAAIMAAAGHYDAPAVAGALLGLSVALQLAIGRGSAGRIWGAAGLIYAAILLICMVLVRRDPTLGIWAVGWMFAVVWATDIAAFFVGRALGGPKLMPSVSPKKTWSGFLGGVAAAILAGTATGLAAAHAGISPMPLPALAALSGLAAMLAQAGDLAESALKRRAGAKDSGRIIPGHGGLMDRLDGFWAVTALVLVLLGTRAMLSQ